MNRVTRHLNVIRKYFFLAVNTGLMQGSVPDARCRDFYRARSKHGLHCSIVGNVVTPNGVGSNNVCSEISNDPGWYHLADAIAEQGAIAGIQLSSTWKGYQGIRSFLPSSGDKQIAEYKKIALSLSMTDVMAAFDSLRWGTDLAIKAGFRHVQLHAAHGYLFNLLIDRRLSSHADLARQSIEAWARDLASAEIETSIRFSMSSGHPVFDQDQGQRFVDEVASMPVNYLDASAGFYNINKRLIYPSTSQLLLERVDATLAIAKRHPAANLILSGMSSHAWSGPTPPNVHIGICRDLIANPDYLLERTNGCSTCMKCHYFSRGAAHLTCGQWAQLSQTPDIRPL